MGFCQNGVMQIFLQHVILKLNFLPDTGIFGLPKWSTCKFSCGFSINMNMHFEVKCKKCGYFQLWGMEQSISALIRAGKLSLKSDFDADIIKELFPVLSNSIMCSQCKTTGSITAKIAPKDQWSWADEVRCEDCGCEIPIQRLAAVPGTTRCIKCQQLHESHF